MSDKARGALFNVLGDIDGLTVLDPFAGTGALSFEAISRGVASATAIDSDRTAQKTIRDNIKKLGLDGRVKLIAATANAWLSTSPNETFDLVLCDPPHDNLQPNLLQRLAERTKPGGIVVLSLPPSSNFELPTNYQLVANKSYGDIRLEFYKR